MPSNISVFLLACQMWGVFLEINRGFQRGIDLPCLESFAPVEAMTIDFSIIGNKRETVDVTPVCL